VIQPLESSNIFTAAVTTMVFQPNTVSGNAPKNPRFILYLKESAPSGPNTAEVEKASS